MCTTYPIPIFSRFSFLDPNLPFQIFLAERPEYNDKIIQGNLLAPAAFMTKAPHPIFLLTEWAGDFETLFHLFGMYEFMPNSEIISWIGHHLCNHEAVPDLTEICDNVFFALFGYNPDQFNR